MEKFNIEINAEMISFDNPYELTLKTNQDKHSGVYVMYNSDDDVLYVGKSKNLGARMRSHLRLTPFFHDIERLVLWACVGGYEREVLETHLIEELRPMHNKSKTYFRSGDYADEVEEIDYEVGELLAEISDLTLDLNGIGVSDLNMYDRYTANNDRLFIREEIQDKSGRVAELRRRKQSLTMRTS